MSMPWVQREIVVAHSDDDAAVASAVDQEVRCRPTMTWTVPWSRQQ